MLTFKQFISENEEFEYDNPGGNWLARKQKEADKDYHASKGLWGPMTAWAKERMKFAVAKIRYLPGAHGEHAFRDDPKGVKSAALEKEVGNPANFNSYEYPITIAVNHRGEAFITEGNHRLAYAKRHGIPYIYAKVRYFNGGELAKGPFNPKNLKVFQ